MSIGVAIHFLSCLPQFCLHSESDCVIDMRTGAVVRCLDDGDEEEKTNLFITWPGLPKNKGSSIGAAKYLELQTSEAAALSKNRGELETALQAALIAIGLHD
jgi:hypothetical protein